MRKVTRVQPKVFPLKAKTPKAQILDLECDNLADQVNQILFKMKSKTVFLNVAQGRNGS